MCPVLNGTISVPRIVIVTTELTTTSFLKKEGFNLTLKVERSPPRVPGQRAGSTAGGRELDAQLLLGVFPFSESKCIFMQTLLVKNTQTEAKSLLTV